ncbi:MAG: HAMP domain-containing histidine kinase [Chloroflexota bacterium]|nr:HAMP domain-containing histidine kinase [Chloroflexota bacterium]
MPTSTPPSSRYGLFVGVEIAKVCRAVVRAFQPVAAGRAITLTADLPSGALLVRGDEVRLGQVLRNLLDNALRYTPSGGAVTLTLQACPPDGGGDHRLVLRVSDTGPGIPVSERERVFERFHRGVDQVDRRAGGSGLGLAICKAIVLAHGGRMRVADGAGADTNGPRGGTAIIVVLPVATETTLTTGARRLEDSARMTFT